jgi:acyl-coenzyme A thioesterase PaaI-like protein
MNKADFLTKILVSAREKNNPGKMNFILFKMIPFNKPHGIKVISVKHDSVSTFIPYKKKNFNHLKGIHACAICTAGEFAAGLLLISHLSFDKYRLIMSELNAVYHRQGRSALTATSRFPEGTSAESVKTVLENEDKTLVKMITELTDEEGEAVATITTTWQLKKWEKVSLK